MAATTIKVIHEDRIIIPENRIRRQFKDDKITELANSIAGSNRLKISAKGLLHPVVLAHTADLGYELVAGEHRLRAMKLLHKQGKAFTCEGETIPSHNIPFTLLGDLSPDARREAELEENTVRNDLTWQEEQHARAELHKLRVKQHGEYDKSTQKGWSLKDTKLELGISSQAKDVRDALVLSEHMDDEEVAKAKNPQEAMKILRKKHIKFLTAELAKQYGTDLPEKDFNFHNMKMEDAILNIPDELFDCIVTDPPYGVDAQDFGSQTAHGHDYADDVESVKELMDVFIPEAFRVLKEQAHMYLFCDLSQFYSLSEQLEAAGFTVWPRPIIWAKSGGMLPEPVYGPRYTYECVLYANKGKRPVTAVYGDVVAISAVDGKVSIHAAQKPVALYENLIKRCCNPGDTVADFFAGSGTIFLAAKECKVTAIGFEKNIDSYNAAVADLRE